MRCLTLISVLLLAACGGDECDVDSECGRREYCGRGECRRDCDRNADCRGEEICTERGECVGPDADASVDRDAGDAPDTGGGVDAGPADTGGVDMGSPPVDSGTDTGPGEDTGPGAPGVYLDRCDRPEDCASGRCENDVGGTRFCTRTCSGDGDCASEHLCAEGRCVPHDVGALCDEAADCALELCAGNPATGFGECTARCRNAADCPAGFGCADAGGGTFVCVDIERPCAQCSTGLCLSGDRGCTIPCRSVTDCPRTLPGLGLEYTCEDAGGTNVCVPSAAVLGPDPIGATCRFSGEANFCRSAVCLEDDVTRTNVCTQACSESAGCGEGYSCVPVDGGGGSTVNVCLRDGEEDLDQPCSADTQCISRLCDEAGGRCSRLCSLDGLCPTGRTCAPDPAAPGGPGPYRICQ